MLIFSGIFVFTLLGGVRSDLLSCGTQNIPLDPVTKPSFDMDSQMLASVQDCVWNFTFPEGYMADVLVNGEEMHYMDIVTLYSKFGSNDLYQWINYQGNDSRPSSCFVHIMWPQGQFELDVRTINATQMILTVHVKLVKLQMMTGEIFTTIKNGQPKYIQMIEWPALKKYEIISAEAGVSLSIVLPEYTDRSSLANFFVYEEDDDGNLYFRGTFHTYYADLNQAEIKMPGKKVTIYRAMVDGIVGTVIANDQDNTKNVNFRTTWSPYNMADFDYSSGHYIEADASKGLIGAVTVLNQASGENAIYFTGVEFKNDAATAVKVIAGGMVADYMNVGTYLGTYNESDYGLPVFLPGSSRTFIIENGGAVVYFTVKPNLAHYSDAVNGRSGFLMTRNYPFSSINQDSDDFVLKSLNTDPFTFTYTITAQNPTLGAYLNVTLLGENGGGATVASNHIVNMSTVTPGDYQYTANQMTFTIYGGHGISTGTLIPYRISSTANPPPVDQTTTRVAPASVTSTSPALSTSRQGSATSGSSTEPSTVSRSTTVGSTGPSSTTVPSTTKGSTVSSSTVPTPSATSVSGSSPSRTVSPRSTVISTTVGVSEPSGGASSNSTVSSSMVTRLQRSTTPSGMDTATRSASGLGSLLIASAVTILLAF